LYVGREKGYVGWCVGREEGYVGWHVGRGEGYVGWCVGRGEGCVIFLRKEGIYWKWRRMCRKSRRKKTSKGPKREGIGRRLVVTSLLCV